MIVMRHTDIKKLVFCASLIAIGYVLPFMTGQIREIGNMLLPMHIPVMLAGLLLGWRCGATVGFVLPLTRSLIFTMPAMYPSAVAMAFELATYGAVAGILAAALRVRPRIVSIYISLIVSMLAGRAVWGAVMALLMRQSEGSFGFSAFISGALLNAIPGIIIQLVFIPVLVFALEKTKAFHDIKCTKM